MQVVGYQFDNEELVVAKTTDLVKAFSVRIPAIIKITSKPKTRKKKFFRV